MPDEPLLPRMSEAEVETFRRHLSGVRSYVEFGSGGSTIMAVTAKNIRRAWSIEGDPQWHADLSKRKDVRAAVRRGRLRLQYVDIGTVGRFSKPTDDRASSRWHQYYDWLETTPDAANANLFLIDGRFRVACALSVLMVCRPNATIIIHDFWNRPEYHAIMRFTDWAESADTLAVLKPRRIPKYERWRLSEALDKYRLDTR
jgi:hypothetical protein